MTITTVEATPGILTQELLSQLGYSVAESSSKAGTFTVSKHADQWLVEFATKTAALAAASVEAFREGNLSQCLNCEAVYIDGNLKQIQHYHQRVDDGEEEPSGECPACGCLCHWIQ